MIVFYPCAQLAVLYTYNCLLILNQLIINKYAVRSRYVYGLWNWWRIRVHHHSIHYNLVEFSMSWVYKQNDRSYEDTKRVSKSKKTLKICCRTWFHLWRFLRPNIGTSSSASSGSGALIIIFIIKQEICRLKTQIFFNIFYSFCLKICLQFFLKYFFHIN